MLAIFEAAALQAGKAIMEVLAAGAHVQEKPDLSPVTEADTRAERIILDKFAASLPGIPVIAEESVAAGRVPDIAAGTFILVDPLDGTREFVSGNSDFTVNIALIEQGRPVAGVVYAPALGIAYLGASGKAEKLTVDPDFTVIHRQPITTRLCPINPVAVSSRSHGTPETSAFLAQHGLADCASVGSSLKFGLVAEGRADIYPRMGRTMQWDTAAGDAVLRAAGGMTFGPDGEPLVYGFNATFKHDPFANPNFIACGRPDEHEAARSCASFRR
ncbi:3'(2'),5'-bisphosphate nucleotidase CysQ [Rhizobium sp. RU36D]|uniref:3'(2'),5'-bisphosphate nucleotidase CysQ n=1 Tax=Rhizobium sp. RU36D TaxID=1907415 RepID=UPI000A050186|nr:3'(2'),5'-bisphosphate nucleotidase CysQ [Rhizobium sp. RU36D]